MVVCAGGGALSMNPVEDAAGALACFRSAALLLKAGEFAAAREQYQRALEADPASKRAHAGMYYALAGLGDAHHAAAHLGQALQLRSLVRLPYRGSGTPISILVLLSINAGNVLIQRFLDDRIFETHLLFVEFYKEGMALPPHRLAINALGDADVRNAGLYAAEAILRRTQAPVINPPERVKATGRCENARRLGRIPGVVTPLTVQLSGAQLSRTDLAAGNGAARLRGLGFSFPLLMRAPGYHMGQHFVRVDSAGELDDALGAMPGEQRIVMQYLDGRGRDGKVRKYRVLAIDGRFYPVHLAISSHWKIHYFSADMEANASHRAEEAQFLDNMAAVLGSGTMAALQRIQEALGLDYAGIDFGLNRRGEVLLFEANATMAVYRPDADARWDYRRASIERIYAAVHRMLIERAA